MQMALSDTSGVGIPMDHLAFKLEQKSNVNRYDESIYAFKLLANSTVLVVPECRNSLERQVQDPHVMKSRARFTVYIAY